VNRSEDIPNAQADETDWVMLWRVAWGSRYLISLSVLVCGLIALYLALTAIPIFRAEVVVTTVRQGGLNASSSLSNQLGGLAGIASLAGVNLETGNGAEREARALLQSRHMVEEFIKTNDLIGELLPHPKKPATLWRAVKEFREGVITIREEKRTGLTTIAMDWMDPGIAAEWANSFVALTNNRIRTRAIDDSSRNIAFLNKQIAQTNVVEVQRVMYNLIENETKTLMLANARVEYAFTIIDPAVPPELKISPKRTLIVAVGILVGLVFGLLAAYFRSVGK
jgi:uncharacterized protein involved in exopolysaccharide biosynthesis